MSEKEGDSKNDIKGVSRRDFIRTGAITAAAIGMSPFIAGGMKVDDLYAAAPVKPKRGGIFRYRMNNDAQTLNHHKTLRKPTYYAVSPAYSRLLKYRHGMDVNPIDLTMVPDLAERWEMKNNKTYIFYLRKGVRFHNRPPVNGRELTSADVKYTYQNILDPKVGSALAYMFTSVEEIRTPDKYTVEFRLKEPYAPFLEGVGSHYAFIFPHEVIEQDGALGKHVIGTGPFIFEGWEKGVKVSYSRNPDYFLTGHPYLDGVEIIPVPEQATVLAMFRSGQLEATEESDYRNAMQTRKLMPKARIEKTFNGGTMVMLMRYMKGPFAKKEVRQAIQMAIDLKGINKIVFSDQGALTSWVPALLGKWALPAADLERIYGQKSNVEKAKRLLHSAGYPNGFETTCVLNPSYGSWLEDTTLMIVSQLDKIGVKVRIIPMEDATYTKAQYGGDFDMLIGLMSPVTEPHDWTYNTLHPKGTRNMAKVDDPKLNPMLEQQMREVDVAKRVKIIRDIQYYLAENAYVIPILQYPMWAYIQDYVQEYRWHRSFAHEQLVDTWLDKK